MGNQGQNRYRSSRFALKWSDHPRRGWSDYDTGCTAAFPHLRCVPLHPHAVGWLFYEMCPLLLALCTPSMEMELGSKTSIIEFILKKIKNPARMGGHKSMECI